MSAKQEPEPMGLIGASRALEVDPDTYNELSLNLKTAVSVAASMRGILPPYIAARFGVLETALARCQGAVGNFKIPPLYRRIRSRPRPKLSGLAAGI